MSHPVTVERTCSPLARSPLSYGKLSDLMKTDSYYAILASPVSCLRPYHHTVSISPLLTPSY